MKFNEIDKRDFETNRATPARRQELNSEAEEVSKRLPGSHIIKIDKFESYSGNFAEIVSESAPIPEDPGLRTSYVARAQQYLQAVSPALGLESTQPSEFKMDSTVQVTSANTKVVHAQQTYLSKDVFQTGTSVIFDSNDAVKGITGNVVSINQNLDALPKLTARDAVSITAKLLLAQPKGQKDQFGESLEFEKLNLEGFEPEVDVVIEGPSMITYFKPGPFAERTKARLLWFELKPNDLRLAWEVITKQKNSVQYLTIVDATKVIPNVDAQKPTAADEENAILYHKLITQFLRSQMNVYVINGSTGRKIVDCPLSLNALPRPRDPPLPTQFPDHWNDDSPISVGNSTYAHLGTSTQVCNGANQENTIVFNPQDPIGDQQKVLNIFYYNCIMHDYFYALGFRERDGNFQHDNLGRGGSSGDRVDARSHSGQVWGTANMGTRNDGISPIMNMGMVMRTQRHTAFDSDVVFHEFMHGVTNRLVGGPMNTSALLSPQSGGMGEGWGDYVGCTINKKNVVGDWVVDDIRGIRNNKYDSNFPHNFGHLGRDVDGVDYTEVHNIGEIWCATLCEMNRNLNDDNLAMQLVVDALKLSPVNPSFLNMRDSILMALDAKLANNELSTDRHSQVKKGIWKAFAKFGMGPNARSNGAQLSGIQPDFNPPST